MGMSKMGVAVEEDLLAVSRNPPCSFPRSNVGAVTSGISC